MTDLVALITGASAGIGTELARVFASKGHRLALVDRLGDRLIALGNEIVAAGGSAPILIPCDLEQPDAGDKIEAALAAAGVEVEFVVNNAGFGLHGHAIDLDRQEHLGIIAVNILALTDLSLRFSDSLIRHRGGVLNLGSIAGFLPGPGMAVYYASKAYVLSFSEALRRELAPRGVRVTTLCPGSVSSEFQARAGLKPGFEHYMLNVSASDVAQAGYRGLMANKRAVPAAEVYIRQGDVIARDSAEARAVNVLDATRTHRFSLLAQKPRVSSPGDTIHVASAKEYPISTTITGVVTRLQAGAMHAPHWHPNANEWHYVARGRTQVTLFAPDKRMAVAELSPGDCAYIPRGCGHSVLNVGAEECEIVGVLDSATYSESSLIDWIAKAPRHVLTNNLGLPAENFAAATNRSVIISAS